MAGPCKHGNGNSFSVKGGYLYQPSDRQFIKDSAAWIGLFNNVVSIIKVIYRRME